MKHKLCMWLLFSMSFLMAFATMEKHGSSAFCVESSSPSVESLGQEVTYWTSDTPYFFFTSDYIARCLLLWMKGLKRRVSSTWRSRKDYPVFLMLP